MRRRRKNIKSPFNVPEDSFFVRLWLLHPLLGRNEGRFNCRQMKEMFVLRFTSDTTPPLGGGWKCRPDSQEGRETLDSQVLFSPRGGSEGAEETGGLSYRG